MTVFGGPRTSFDAGAFTAGAVGGSVAVAGALVQGFRNARAALSEVNLARWEGWTREQLERAADLNEELRRHQYERAETLQRDNDRLRRVVERLTVRRRQRRG